MSPDEKNEALAQIHAFQATLAKYVDAQRERQAAEAARRARLTPEQRAAEDRVIASRAAQAERQKLAQKIAKFGDPIRKADTWTIENFCWLLLAEKPAEPESFFFFDGRSSKATRQHQQFRAILESCVHTRLKPVNPEDPTEKFRFSVRDLVEVARVKRLGCFELLAEFLDLEAQRSALAPSSSVASSPTEAQAVALVKAVASESGSASRETQKLRRRTQLVQFARSLAKSGNGSDYKDHIAISMLGVELNEMFRSAFPEWKETADKTLEADRAEVRPRIRVRTGRRRNEIPS